MDDVTPGDDDAELEALEADLATIEDAMAKVDAGDLAGYEEATSKCWRYQHYYHPEVLQDAVVVGEYDDY